MSGKRIACIVVLSAVLLALASSTALADGVRPLDPESGPIDLPLVASGPSSPDVEVYTIVSHVVITGPSAPGVELGPIVATPGLGRK